MTEIYDRPVERSHSSVGSTHDELYRSLFERSGLGIARLDRGWRVFEANADLLNLLDRPIQDVHGRDFTELIHPGVRAGLKRHLSKLVEGKRGRFTEHVAAIRPDGTAVPVNMTAIAVRGHDPSTAAVLVILRQGDGGGRVVVDQSKVLTDVHARILEGVAAGESTVQLASQLYLSRQGVEYHVGTMLRKLKAPNRTALVSRAYALGMLSVASWPPRVLPDFVK